MNRSELLKIRNFGEKSYVELFDRMRASTSCLRIWTQLSKRKSRQKMRNSGS